MQAISKSKTVLIAEIQKLKQEITQLNKKQLTEKQSATPLWKSYFKKNSNFILVLNKEGVIIDINNTSKKYNKTALVGTSILKYIDKPTQKVVKEAIGKAFIEKKRIDFKTNQTDKKGNSIPCKNELTPILKNKAVVAVLLEGADIINKNKVEDGLIPSEQLYKHFLEEIPSPVIIYSNFKIVYANKATYQLLQLINKGKNKAKNSDIFSFVLPEYHSIIKERSAKILNGDKLPPFEFKVKLSSGKIIFIETKSSLVNYNGQQVIQSILNDITHRKNVEQVITESQNNLTQVLNNINELVYFIEFLPKNNQRIKYIGKQIETILGITQKEYEQNSLIKWVHPQDLTIFNRNSKILKNTKKSQQATYRFFHPRRKKYIHIEERIAPQLDSSGNYIGNFGLIREVTNQIEHEQQLNQQTLRAQNYLDVANVVLIVFNRDQTVALINKMGCRLLGYKESEIIGKNWFDNFVPKEVRKIRRDWFLKSIEGKHTQDIYTGEILSKKGEIRIISWKGALIRDNKNNITSILSSGEDITKKLIAEKALKDSEKRFRLLSNTTFEGIVFSENGRVIDVNDQTLKMFEYSNVQELIGKHLLVDFVLEKEHNAVRKFFRSRKAQSLEIQTKTKTGRIRTVEAKTQMIPYFGRTIHATVIYDITERKQYELQIEQSRENYKNLIDSSPIGILIYKRDELQFANSSALKLLEAQTFDTIYLTSLYHFIAPEYKNQITEQINVIHKIKTFPTTEIKVKTLKNNIKEFEISFASITYNGGDAIQVLLQDNTAKKQLIKEQLRAQLAEETNSKLQQEISDRKETERQLKETQKYTRLLIDSSLDMICAFDKKGNITEFNTAAQKIFGYELSEIIGKPVEVLYPNSEYTLQLDELYTKEKFAGEVINIKKNGEKFIAYLSSSVLKNEKSVVVGAMWVSRDISEIKKAEEELRDSEERYRAIYNQVFIGIAQLRLGGKFMQVNDQICKMLGYSKEELCHKSWNEIIVKETPKLSNYMEKLINGHTKKINFEKNFFHKKGHVVNANATLSVVIDAHGNPSHFIAILQNITEQKKLEQDKQAQAARHDAIIENSSHIIWTIDRQMCLTSFNKNYVLDLKKHYNVEALVGLSAVSIKLVLTEEYNNYWLKKYEAVLRGEAQYFETKMIDKQNNIVWREIFLNPIFDEKGKLVEVAGIGLDITEKKLANEKIRSSLNEKEVLLKEVHHRVKNNLQVISSILNLQSSYVKDQATLTILKESQDRIKSMAFIHESLYQTKDFTSINFSEYIVNLTRNLIHSYSRLNYEIKLNLEIQNVFLNLDLAIPCGLIINEIITNALKYAFVDTQKNAAINVKMDLKDDSVYLQIKDNGKGIPKHISYRNTESLGLQLVVTLVDQLNGTIALNNEAGVEFNIAFKQNQVKNRI